MIKPYLRRVLLLLTLSAFFVVPSVSAQDADADGLSDSQEQILGTNPNSSDSDGDLVSDFDEVNATPPTDPNDPSKYPNSGITRLSLLHALPVAASAPSSAEIDESFAPYGHRPERDKVGDDGSSVIIDRNGVLIWTNKQGVAVTVPGASLAKTLYVSNTECVVYNNRFATTYNSRDEKAEVVIHRRGATGPVTSSKTIMMDGTVLDTCPVTPTTYGFTLVTGRTYEDGAESISVTLTIINTATGPTEREETNRTDFWDVMSVDSKRITWDGEQQQLANTRFPVRNTTQNFDSVVVQGHGSDGSVVFSTYVANDFLDRYDDADPGAFQPAVRSSFWVSLNLGQEKFDQLGEQFSNLAYLTNDRAVLEWEDPSTGNYELQDWRQDANSSVSIAKTIQLPAGERMLPLSTYTIDGLPPYVYTIDTAGTSLRLYKADASLSAVGAAVTLPAKVNKPVSFVRNPRDGSLLIQSEDRGLMWIPTTGSPVITGLGTPQILVNSVEAKPLFVAAKEAVAWLNGKATVINGSLPAAQISHYQFITNGGVVATNLTPPMEGKYVVLPNPLTPDPDLEGWYVTTFEKNAPASTLMRTYQLQVAGSADRDQDGISDYDEMMVTFTDPGDPDTDGDGLLDGQEVRPYQIVTTALSWENARLDAISKGGRLAVLDTQAKQTAFKAAMQYQKADGKYWIGGHDTTTEGTFQWLDAKGLIIPSPEIIAPKNWDQYQPSNLNNADGMEVTSGSDYKWSMAQTSKLQGYVIEFVKTDPLIADSDGDDLSDGDERKMNTDPFKPDTDGDGLSDGGKQFFGSPITVPDGNNISYSNTLVCVDYEGLVMDPVTGIAFKQKLTLTKTGSFTSTLLGLEGDYSYKGTFTSTGAFREDNPDNLQEMGGWLIVDMNLVYQNVSGTYYIQGYFENEAGDQISYELRPARKDTWYAGKKLNFEASVIGAPAGPTGSAVATGSIHKTTSVAIFTVYFPDGSRGSYSGPIVDGRDKGGNLLLPYSFGDLASSPLLVGISVLRTSANQSDVDGTVRLYSGTSDSANLYSDGYDQLRKLKGSFYVPPASSRLPLSTFAGINNTLYRWTDEGGNELTGVGTWTSSKLSLSSGPAQGGSATVDRASGLVTVSRIPSIGSEMRQGKAVVLQISKSVKGFYSSPSSMGSLVLAPNASKISAAVPAVISKSSYSATAPTATYAVTVKATGPWAVSIPTDATWVTATLANASGTPATPTLVDGSGNGTVTITLAGNTTSSNRTAVISIAGVDHTITQAFQPAGISRSSYSGSNAAVSYQVNVVAVGDWSVSIPTNASSWVTATPLSGNGNGTVTITLAKNGTTVKTHKNRSTTITIAGRSHTIKQTWK